MMGGELEEGWGVAVFSIIFAARQKIMTKPSTVQTRKNHSIIGGVLRAFIGLLSVDDVNI
jgi:hypothetical protein